MITIILICILTIPIYTFYAINGGYMKYLLMAALALCTNISALGMQGDQLKVIGYDVITGFSYHVNVPTGKKPSIRDRIKVQFCHPQNGEKWFRTLIVIATYQESTEKLFDKDGNIIS